ncbi:uncharacterized protein EAE98_002845 [Botrytis deweyae]|uniref:Uncharacterized protein n=1 Tax=Botrytis deweyae TaxID=2478750 RepID=A0ABQ7IUY9_9HELO|nr:uncharacterized protein EAE98_002845 [Botrytis deweyae]KAF7934800.1 hypothetical protein EAE98_002845 [Botrytis deweyae]
MTYGQDVAIHHPQWVSLSSLTKQLNSHVTPSSQNQQTTISKHKRYIASISQLSSRMRLTSLTKTLTLISVWHRHMQRVLRSVWDR